MSRTKPRMRERSVQALTTLADRMKDGFPISSLSAGPGLLVKRPQAPGHTRVWTIKGECQAGGLPPPFGDWYNSFVGEEILQEFARFRRRHLWVRGLDLFLEAAFVMTITAAAMLLLDRLSFELGFSLPHLAQRARIAAPLLVPLLLSGAFAAASLLLRPTPPARLAWQVDRASGGEERFLSALE